MSSPSRLCTLQLSNGTSFSGRHIGADAPASGELVFTTGMVGYSEALTDPSYFGQILVFTYPLIGNYGIPKLPSALSVLDSSGFESNKVHAAGVVLAIDSTEAFHWTSDQTLDQWLKSQNVMGIVGLDPRHIVHEIRQNPGLMGRLFISSDSNFKPSQSEAVFFNPSDKNILDSVSCKEPYLIRPSTKNSGTKRIAVVDCGVKWNILRQLVHCGAEVQVIPYNYDFKKVDCQAWLLSNGPGDPTKTGKLCEQVRELISEQRPILGICLGHQVLALAAGARTVKMPYGHRSHNQPVQLVGTRRGFITSQNHGYVVDEATLPPEWKPWFINANDQTIEGIRHKTKPMRSVQFHPEAAGGPRDTSWIIEEFVREV
jgi:carbamoyl-phosphate synthase small subunit